MVEMAQQVFPPGLVQILGGDDKAAQLSSSTQTSR